MLLLQQLHITLSTNRENTELFSGYQSYNGHVCIDVPVYLV